MLDAFQYAMTIDGQPVGASESLAVINPANERIFVRVPDAGKDDVDSAVAAARRAFEPWSQRSLAARAADLVNIAEALAFDAEEFALLLTCEQGKPLAESRAEIARAIDWLRATAELTIPEDDIRTAGGMRIVTRRVPLGVVAAIVPWNFPVTLMIWKVAPALLAGNTVVVKPSPYTPLTALRFGAMIRDILPAGVLNVVSGSDRLGPWLTAHPGIDKIAFTGSTPTGKAIMRAASDRLLPITLELGGNDAAIVMDDVDVETVAPALFWAAFRNNAQVCVAAKRLYIHDSIYDAVAAAIVEYARTVQVGDGLNEQTQIGPLQNKLQFDRVRQLLADARSAGIRFLAGGNADSGTGYFMPISIADNPPDDAPIVREEAFGPILPLLRFTEIDEVVKRANDSELGLGASVWSKDFNAALAIAKRLEAGTVWINTAGRTSPLAPFGGRKQSGVGVENGLPGLLAYTEIQTIMTESDACG